MMRRAIQVQMIPVMMLWLGAMTPALRAENPQAGYRLVSASGSETGKSGQVATFLKKGAEAYERAAFSVAADWYDNARQLAPDRQDIQKMLDMAVEKRAQQREAQQALPADPAARDKFFKESYDKARKLLDRGDAQAAAEAFSKLWLVAGKYEETPRLLAEAEKLAAGKPGPNKAAKAEPPAPAFGAKAQVDALVVTAQREAKAGRNDSARKMLNEAQALDPSNKVVEWNLSRLPEAKVDAAPAVAAAPPVAVEAKPEPVAPPPAEIAAVAAAVTAEKTAPAEKMVAAAEPIASVVDEPKTKSSVEPERARQARKNADELVSTDLQRKIDELLVEAKALRAGGNSDQAERSYLKVLSLQDNNKEAVAGIKDIARVRSQEVKDKRSASATAKLRPIDAGADQAASEPPPVREPGQAAPPMPEPPAPAEKPAKAMKAEKAAPAPKAAAETAPEPGSAEPAMGLSAANAKTEVDRLHREAMTAYRSHDVVAARKNWEAMLAIDPNDKRATTYLEETKAEYERAMADQKSQEDSAKRSRAAQELLTSPVTISTDRLTPLSEFMRIISFSTPTEIEYYIADGAQADVFVNVVDKPLKDVLDTVLTPIGLVWSIDEKNLITIKPEFFPRTYNLSTDQLNKVRSLLDSGDLQRVIWGQPEPPSKGCEMTIDERQRVFMVVGSKLHIQKVDDFMSTLEGAQPAELETQVYKIREEDGAKIKALINALISNGQSTPFDQERKVFIDGTDLIIRDTPENIVKIEELLLDEKFIENLHDQKLDIQNFSLVPRDVENPQSSDQISVFTTRIVESVETFLYARTGKKAAQAEGRRLWFDPATLQLTVVDTPANIAQVGSFVESLPELRQKRLQKVIFLQNQVAEEMASELTELLGLAESEGGKGKGGDQTVKKLRRGDQFQFKDLKVRLIRVQTNDPNDTKDDECELQLNTGTQVSNLTIRNLDTQYFDNYEITAEDVRASGGSGSGVGQTSQSSNAGEGTARILVRYVRPIEGALGTAQADPLKQAAEDAKKAKSAEEGLTINPFGPLNALIVRYDNPARLQEVEELIKQLDKPTKQVEVETKFVQVNETRAREFSAQFNLDGLTNGQGLSKIFNGDYQVNSRFAQFADELRSNAEPFIENPVAANLMQGTTALNLVLGSSGAPSLGFQLRLLESEGIINITNGPKVMMLDAITGQFRIEKIGPATRFVPPTIPGNTTVTQTSPSDTLLNEDGSRFQNRLTSTILEVTPEITSEKSIIFQIVAELLDFDDNEAQPMYLGANALGLQNGGTGTGGVQLPSSIDPAAGTNNDLLSPFSTTSSPLASFLLNTGNLYRSHKMIDTTARTHDGGTIVLGGWTGERAQDLSAGVPVLRNMPYIGKLFFSRSERSVQRVSLLIFLTANLIE